MTDMAQARSVPVSSPARSGRWFVRTQPLAPSILALAMALWLLARASSLLGDPDSQWHVAVGAWIWANGRVPTTDFFSHTQAGAPWIAKEWLSQLLLFAAHRAAGWTGVVVLVTATIAATFGLLHAWMRQRLKATAALAMVLVAITLAQPHFLARPHMLVLPLIAFWTIGLVGARERDAAPSLLLVLGMVAWANMHGSFPLGLVVAGILAVEAVVLAPSGERVAALRGWCVFLAMASLATIISPYGWQAILVPLKMSGNAETLAFVDEWHPLRLDGIGLIALALLALLVTLLARDSRRHAFRLLAIGLLAYLMIRHARFISLFAIVAPILAVDGSRRWAWLGAPRDRGETPETIVQKALCVVLGFALLLTVAIIRPQPAGDVAPDAAYRAAVGAGLVGPVYNDYDFGGYLIALGVKTFVDGRTDQLFLGAFLPTLARAIASPDDAAFAALLDAHGVAWALVRPTSGEAAHLARMAGWTRVHSDADATVFAKR